jgi:magnesium transporter
MPITDKIIEDIHQHRWQDLRAVVPYLHPSELAHLLETLPAQEQAVFFRLLPEAVAAKTFEYLDKTEQQTLIRQLGQREVAALLNGIAPDDRTAFLEELPAQVLHQMLTLLTDDERSVASTLLGYPEESIGRKMTPYYVALRPNQTVAQVLAQIRLEGRKSETITHLYVVDEQHVLIDDLRIAQILFAPEEANVESLMDRQFVCLTVTDGQEEAISAFKRYDRQALPVITGNGVLVGIVTADDMLDIIEQADTEDIQKYGGMESLDLPYTRTPMLEMVKKRAGWLIVLFLGEMLTATAMGYFEGEIQKAVVLALFVPLIISSGGNSGSQASTLIIRAMALKELNIGNWWGVMRKEIFSGLLLGAALGAIGVLRITTWQQLGWYDYGPHWFLVSVTIFFSLIGIVLWGTVSGSMIPFVLRRFGLDPATSSAPFVATLVDVTGLIIYFSVASIILRGTLL